MKIGFSKGVGEINFCFGWAVYMYSLTNCYLWNEELKMFNRNKIRLLKKGRRKTAKKTTFLELRKYKSDIIANSKIFFSFSNKMEIKEEWGCCVERTDQDKWSFSVWIPKFQTAFYMRWLVRKGGDGKGNTKFKMKMRLIVLFCGNKRVQ